MIKRKVESTLNKFFANLRKLMGLLNLTHSFRLIQIAYVVSIVALMTGMVSALVQPVDQRFIIFPGRGAQSISETIINAFVVLLGSLGVYMTYLSGKQTTRPRMSGFYLILAIMLLFSATFLGIYINATKG